MDFHIRLPGIYRPDYVLCNIWGDMFIWLPCIREKHIANKNAEGKKNNRSNTRRCISQTSNNQRENTFLCQHLLVLIRWFSSVTMQNARHFHPHTDKLAIPTIFPSLLTFVYNSWNPYYWAKKITSRPAIAGNPRCKNITAKSVHLTSLYHMALTSTNDHLSVLRHYVCT